MNRLTEREAQASAITEELRDAGDETNPVLEAEAYPNRFRLMTYFFQEQDGVRIEEDLDLNSIVVEYFWDGGREALNSGSLYEWAMAQYLSD